MKVLYACLVQDSRAPDEGYAWEYHNIYEPLDRVVDEVEIFDFFRLAREEGREEMNRRLVETARRTDADLALFSLYQDEFEPEAVEEVREHLPTLHYFIDDDWRRDFARKWIPRFDYVATPRTKTLHRYRLQGLENVLYLPFGFNEERYDRPDVEMRYDVSFVGGAHPWRQFVVRQLEKAGIDVAVFGPFWKGTRRLDLQEMVEVYAASRINLNLSNSTHWDARYLLTTLRGLRTTLTSEKNREQIKARHFEIPACGGFQLTYYCDDLERHFEIGDEVAVFTDIGDLVDKIQIYLQDDEARRSIAQAGYERAWRDHRASDRMRDMLTELSRMAPSIPAPG